MKTKLSAEQKGQWIDFLGLAIIVLFVFSPFVFQTAGTILDNISIYLPWKHFIVETLRNGNLPIWNPFVNHGFIQAADPGTWYPISWLFGIFGTYNLNSINYEMIFHYWLAGVGFYKISRYYSLQRTIAFSLGCIYMLSGFFISNAQHGGWLVSASWIPFAYYYFLRCCNSNKIADAIKLTISLFLLFTGGYIAFFITLVYIFIAHYVYLCIQRKKLIAWKLFIFSSIFFLILCSPAIYYIFEYQPFSPRETGLDFDNGTSKSVVFGSLRLSSLLSFLFPYSSTSYHEFWIIDVSLSNIYIGWLSLIILVIGLFTFRKSKRILYFLAGFLFIGIALATIFPFRYWMYEVLPLMKIFRFSALFRIFTIYFFLLGIGFTLQLIQNDKNKNRLFNQSLLFISVLAFLSGSFFWIRSGFITPFSAFSETPQLFLFYYKIALDSFILLTVCLVSLLLRKKLHWSLITLFCFISVIDMSIHAKLNFYTTVASKMEVKEINNSIAKGKEGYKLNSLKLRPIDYHQIIQDIHPTLWYNQAHYTKSISSDGTSPYYFNHQHNAHVKNTLEPLYYLPFVFISEVNNSATIDTSLVLQEETSNIIITYFDGQKIKVITNTNKPATLVLQQNYFPHWKAFVGNEETAISLVNETFMQIKIPAGEQEVTFTIDNKIGKALFALSSTVLLLFIIALFLLRFRFKNGINF